MTARARIAAMGLGAALSMVAGFEGLRTVAYLDPAQIWTICYGHIQGVRAGDVKSPAECEGLLAEEFLAAVSHVDRCSPVPLTPNQRGALASAVYNLGPSLVCDPKRSTLARRLRAGDIVGACHQLTRWVKARVLGVLVPLPGLIRRREAERAMCLA